MGFGFGTLIDAATLGTYGAITGDPDSLAGNLGYEGLIKKGQASLPGMSAAGTASGTSMQNMQSDADHYQVGAEMSAPMQGVADRGQARGDAAQSTLGAYGHTAAAYGDQAAGYGAQGAEYGAGAAQYGAQGAQAGQQGNRDLVDAAEVTRDDAAYDATRINRAGQAGAQDITQAGQASFVAGRQVASQGNNMLGRDAYGMNMGASNAASGQAQAYGGQLAGLEAQEGPSAAQAQLQAGSNRAMAQNLAMSRAGRGFGQQGSSLLQAQFANAAQQQNTANQAAQLRAQENAAWRQRQAQNLGAAAGISGQAAGLGLAQQQALAQNEQFQRGLNQQGYLDAQRVGLDANAQNLQAAQAAGALGLQGATSAGQLGLAGNQSYQDAVGQGANLAMQGANIGMAGQAAGMQGAQVGIAGSTAGMQGAAAGGALAGQGYGMGFQGDQQAMAAMGADFQAKQAYEQMLLQRAGIQTGVSMQNAASSNAFMGGMFSTMGQVAGAGMKGSDIRAKEDVKKEAVTAPSTDTAPGGIDQSVWDSLRSDYKADYLSGGGSTYGNVAPALTGPAKFTDPGFDNPNLAAPNWRHGDGLDATEPEPEAEPAEEATSKPKKDSKGGVYVPPTPFPDPGTAGFDMVRKWAPQVPQAGYTSDKETKSGVRSAADEAREAVRNAPAFSFRYRDPDRHGDGRYWGGMAQDYEKTPAGRSIVHEDPRDGTKMIDGGRAALLSLAAQHGQEDEIRSLKERIASIESSFGKKGKSKRRAA